MRIEIKATYEIDAEDLVTQSIEDIISLEDPVHIEVVYPEGATKKKAK